MTDHDPDENVPAAEEPPPPDQKIPPQENIFLTLLKALGFVILALAGLAALLFIAFFMMCLFKVL